MKRYNECEHGDSKCHIIVAYLELSSTFYVSEAKKDHSEVCQKLGNSVDLVGNVIWSGKIKSLQFIADNGFKTSGNSSDYTVSI